MSILIQAQHSRKKGKYYKQTDRCLNIKNLANNEMCLCKSENSTLKVNPSCCNKSGSSHPSLTKIYMEILPLDKFCTFFQLRKEPSHMFTDVKNYMSRVDFSEIKNSKL